MKKIYTFGLAIVAIAALAACNKINVEKTPIDEVEKVQEVITVNVSTEDVCDNSTKVTVSESGDKFYLNWQGTETFGVANSTTTNTSSSPWTITSYSGRNANITGTLPTASGSTTNYVVCNNLFSSASGVARVVVPANQSYNGANISQNCLLVARADDSTVGTLPDIEFKTMNAFMKLSLVKGSAAPGSTNDYTKMYVQNITVEAIGNEDIAGRFEISKTAIDWTDNYSGTVAGQMTSKVTLDCTVINVKGEELSALAKDFYLAIAFGTYASGLKITINVQNQDGDAGTVEKTFGTTSGISIDRNTMRALSSLTVNPVDAAAPDTYTLITDPGDIASGEKYLLAGYRNSKYHLWTGSITTTTNKDLITAEYSYNTTTGVLTGDGAIEVTLTTTGKSNQYYVKVGDNYLGTSAKTNRRMTLNDTSGYWTFGSDDRGGMTMLYSNYAEYLQSSTGDSNVLRNYGSSTSGDYGVYLFHKD